MQTYLLREMLPAHVLGRRTSILKGIAVEVPLGTERQIVIELRRVIRALHGEVREGILPRVVRELDMQRERRRLTRDAVDLSWFENLERLSESLMNSIMGPTGRLRNVFWHQVEHHTQAFTNSIRRGFGVDVSNIIRNTDMLEFFDNAMLRGRVALKGWASDAVQRVRRVVTAGVIAGSPVAEIRRDLREQFETIDRRAQGLARDETATNNTEMTEVRHAQAGVDEYMWMTRKDERVRPLHQRLQGRIYRQGQPTGAERGLPPGKPYGCRCCEAPIIRLPYNPR